MRCVVTWFVVGLIGGCGGRESPSGKAAIVDQRTPRTAAIPRSTQDASLDHSRAPNDAGDAATDATSELDATRRSRESDADAAIAPTVTATWGNFGSLANVAVAVTTNRTFALSNRYEGPIELANGTTGPVVLESLDGAPAQFTSALIGLDASLDFVWSHSVPGSPHGALASAPDDGVYVGNLAYDFSDFGPGTPVVPPAHVDSYMSRFNRDGERLWTRIWARGDLFGTPRITANEDSVYLCDVFRDAFDLDPGPNVREGVPVGAVDVFVAALRPTGELAWATTFGAPEAILSCDAIALTPNGDVVVSGGCDGVPVGVGFTDASQQGRPGCNYVRAFDGTGHERWQYSLDVPPPPRGLVSATTQVAASSTGVLALGRMEATPGTLVDFDPGPGTDDRPISGPFVTAIGLDGSPRWTELWSHDTAVLNEFRQIVALDREFVIGTNLWSLTMSTPTGTVDVTGKEGIGALLAVRDDGTAGVAWTVDGPRNDAIQSVACLPDRTCAIGGVFAATVDFDPGPASDVRVALGPATAFVSRLLLP